MHEEESRDEPWSTVVIFWASTEHDLGSLFSQYLAVCNTVPRFL